MVKKRKQSNTKKWNIKGFKKNCAKTTKINALTKYDGFLTSMKTSVNWVSTMMNSREKELQAFCFGYFGFFSWNCGLDGGG
jgi:hypothetical protein